MFTGTFACNDAPSFSTSHQHIRTPSIHYRGNMLLSTWHSEKKYQVKYQVGEVEFSAGG